MLTIVAARLPSIWAKAAGVLLFTMFTAVCTRFTVTLPLRRCR